MEGKAIVGVKKASSEWRRRLDLWVGSRSVVAGYQKRFPNHGSVAFHPCWSSIIQKSFDFNSQRILQIETEKGREEGGRFKGQRYIERKNRNREKEAKGREKDKRDYSLSETEIYSIQCSQCNTFNCCQAKKHFLK